MTPEQHRPEKARERPCVKKDAEQEFGLRHQRIAAAMGRG